MTLAELRPQTPARHAYAVGLESKNLGSGSYILWPRRSTR
jgi:hypothetical protein